MIPLQPGDHKKSSSGVDKQKHGKRGEEKGGEGKREEESGDIVGITKVRWIGQGEVDRDGVVEIGTERRIVS